MCALLATSARGRGRDRSDPGPVSGTTGPVSEAAGGPVTATVPVRMRSDYVGAVYGSLLAASVVAGTGADGEPLRPLDLAALLLGTGVAFFVAHVYAQVAGAPGTAWRDGVRRSAVREWPLVQAAFPPAVVAVLGGLAGLPNGVTSLLALGVAVAGQVGWAVLASLRAGFSRRGTAVSGAVNLLIGLAILALEISLY
jgi:hypothetical protein